MKLTKRQLVKLIQEQSIINEQINDLNKIKIEYSKIMRNGFDDKLEFIKLHFPKINPKDIEEALYIQETFEGSPPETYSEMTVASRLCKWFYKFMKKHPELDKIGFDENVVYDPKDDF